MEQTTENIQLALEWLLTYMSWMKGFPGDNEKALELRAKSLLRLVHNKPIEDVVRWGYTKADRIPPEIIELPDPLIEAGVAPETNDVEWLMTAYTESEAEFPAPIQLRKFYHKHGLRPADNICPDIFEPPAY